MKNITTFDIFLGIAYSIVFGLYWYSIYLFPYVLFSIILIAFITFLITDF